MMNAAESPRLLIVRRDNIGDLICTTPLIAALRARFPHGYIGALVNSYNRAVLSGNSDLDEVFSYTKWKHRDESQGWFSALAGRARLLRDLRNARIEIAVLATPMVQPRVVRLARLAGAKQIAAFANQPGARGVDWSIPQEPGKNLHEVEDVFRLAFQFKVQGPPPPMKLFPDPHRVDALVQRFPALAGPGSRRIAIHISARKPSQRWPAANFVALARALSDRLIQGTPVQLILLWAPGASSNALHPGDEQKAREITGALAGVGISAIATDTLEDLIAAISLGDVLVCADGGAMHIGAALGKSIVCLFGDSNPARWRPWRARHELLQAPSRDVKDIAVDEVIAAVEKILGPETP